MDFAAAAAFPISYTTAHVGLSYPIPVKATDVVLVHAAAGGIGIAATQLAKAAGATVIATASSTEKLEIAKRNGADMVINYRDTNWVSAIKADFPDGIQIVIDPVGDAFTNESLRCLGWRGHLRLVGFAAGKPAKIPANHLLVKAATATGVYWNFENDGELVRTMQDDLVERLRSGTLRPLIGGTYPLASYLDALKTLEDGKTVGKLILTM
jgi:NADPH:quinone reductase